jgi:hypothetical protein
MSEPRRIIQLATRDCQTSILGIIPSEQQLHNERLQKGQAVQRVRGGSGAYQRDSKWV